MKTTTRVLPQLQKWKAAALAALAVAALSATPVLAGETPDNDNDGDDITFDLVPSKGLPDAALKGALKNAHGKVHITSVGTVEIMEVAVFGLPPNTDFDFFAIQQPNKPFGLAWYQGDIETNKDGNGFNRFIGRFNIETFIVAPQGAKAPIVFRKAFPDASMSPMSGRIHTYHLGLWFNSQLDGEKAGAPGVTPFNGEGNAGVQVLNTGGFDDHEGPLKSLGNP